MKKMFYTLALIVSSFFFFFSNVNAEEKVINVDLDKINDNFYKAKSIVDNYISTNNYSSNYAIFQFRSSSYYAYIYRVSSYSVSFNYSSSEVRFSPYIAKFQIDIDNSSLVPQGNATNNPNIFLYQFPLYSTINIITDSSNNVLIYKVGEYEKSIVCDGNNKLLTYYDIYQEINNLEPVIDHTHDSELSIIQSFYDVSISKISYLADSISSNYIYLSIFGVFILIFVFELIFRRYL